MISPRVEAHVGRARRSSRSRHPAAGPGPAVGRNTNYAALLMITLALSLMGLIMVLSASTIASLDDQGSIWFYFQRQALYTIVGAVGLWYMQRTDYRRLAPLAPLLIGGSVVLLILVLIPGVGVSANGATRWLGFSWITIQPAEFAKLAVAIFVASLLARRADLMDVPQVTERPVLVVTLGCALLVLLQPSQGTAMIIVAMSLVLLFLAGAALHRLLVLLAAAGGLALLLATSASYRWARVQAVLDPWDDPLNTGFQTIQSLVGIAGGGVSGVGLGAGRAKWGFLPFAHTDFIFAVIAEELGLVGAVIVIGLFLLLAAYGIRTARSAPDRFGALLAAGICSWITMQAFINIGTVIGLLPISGVTLPFMSVGGSSLIVTMTAMGIVLNIARQSPRAPLFRGRSAEPTESESPDEPAPASRFRPQRFYESKP